MRIFAQNIVMAENDSTRDKEITKLFKRIFPDSEIVFLKKKDKVKMVRDLSGGYAVLDYLISKMKKNG